MALSQRLDLRQTQALVMTPQLQQAIKLLQMSNIEVEAFVEQEIESNPLLEREEPGADGPDERKAEGAAAADPPLASSPETGPDTGPELAGSELTGSTEAALAEGDESWRIESGAEGSGDNDWAGDPDGGSVWTNGGGPAPDSDDLPTIEQTLAKRPSLREHLHDQIGMEIGDPAERIVAAHLVEMLDEAGYILGDLDGLARFLGCERALVDRVLAKLQRLDPPGVFARNLAECLGIQLADRNRLDPAMQTLLANLPLLAARDAPALLRLCGVDAEDLAEMVAEIRSLDPKPGLAFDPPLAQPVTPDILMRPQANGAGWIVELNADTLPRVLVNTRYYAHVSRTTKGRADREYLSERFQSANWLVKSLHQRATTILKVATEIVHQQEAFFLHGVQHLRPLILRDIAAAIGMHESTVSRVTTAKYIATPRGIHELKYFFTSAIAASRGGDAHSAEAVRFRIKALIEHEPATDTLSDEKIVEILQRDGVDIARRTVAKYREALRIPSSLQRRREKTIRL